MTLSHRSTHPAYTVDSFCKRLHLDGLLLASLILLTCVGFLLLYSASHSLTLVIKQAIHIALAYAIMILLAQISPSNYHRMSLFIYIGGIFLLCIVLVLGHVGLGARRWLALGPVHFQPSEILKLAIPMLLAARYVRMHLPPSLKEIMISLCLILIPALLTAKQPDLGTAILLVAAGLSTLFLAGLKTRYIVTAFIIFLLLAPLVWYYGMHDYQHQRILTFLSPERAPLGTGYHIIQSKIAIGAGGFWGNGWMHSTQANLHFLPEHTTDFIFSVILQEFGLVGALCLIVLYALIILRTLFIAIQAQDTFTRLLAGSLSLTFFISVFINMGMVCGIVPVVGLPLPLVSYGGTSMVMLLANFGILMSIQTHRKLMTT